MNDDKQFPCKHIGSQDEQEILSELFEKYFHIHFEWAKNNIHLCDFRKFSKDTCEVVYVCKTPNVIYANKSGMFISLNKQQELQLEIDDFYGRILQEQFRRF